MIAERLLAAVGDGGHFMPTVDACIARLEQGGQSAAVSILRHEFGRPAGAQEGGAA